MLAHSLMVISKGAGARLLNVASVAALLTLILAASPSLAAVYKCTNLDGSTTYGDTPCGSDAKPPQAVTAPQVLTAPPAPPLSSQGAATTRSPETVPPANDKSARETSALLCSTRAYNEWIKAQGHPLPDPNVRQAKMIEISNQCRRPLNLPDMQTPAPIVAPSPVLSGPAGDAAATKLAELVKSGSIERIQQYLSSPGVNINDRPGTDEALLDYAAEQNQVKVAWYLVEHGARVDAVQTQGRTAGYTALHRVAIVDAADVAEILLAHGAEVNVHGPLGITPLVLAASNGSRRTAEVLLNHGADISTTTGHRETALSEATAHGHTDIVTLLLVHVPTPTTNSMNTVAARGDLDALRLMLMHDELVHDVSTASKNEALRFAILGGTNRLEERKQMIELLQAHGADIDNVMADPEVIPLMFAKSPDMIDFMLTHGANHKAQLSGAQLAQAYACNKEVRDPIGALGVLVAHNIDLRGQPSPRVQSALACATRASNPALVQFLSDHGVGVDGPRQVAAASAVSVDPRIVEIRDATVDLRATVESQTIDNVALMMTRQLAPEDPAWNPKNPRWSSMLQRVRADLRTDLSARLAASLTAAQGVWNQALRTSLSEDDVTQLVTYFRTAQGKQYIEFQRRLNVLLTAALLDMLKDPLVAANAKRHAVQDKYAKLLDLSLSIQLAPPTPGTGTPGSPLDPVITALVTSHPAELDQLQAAYQRDLDGFRAFDRSAPKGHLLAANHSAGTQWNGSQMARELTGAVLASVTMHMDAWQRAYAGDNPQRATATTASAIGTVDCVALEKMDNSHQPPEIYRDVRECIDREKYAEAAALFALGGMESQFDAARVSDKTAGQAGQILIMSVSDGISADQQERFRASVRALAADKPTFTTLCNRISTIGYPTYYPEYMIQHGMGAVMGALTGKQERPGIDPSFDARKTWHALQVTYLNCPTAGAGG